MDCPSNISDPLPPTTREADSAQGKIVSRRHLINKLNYLNFQDHTIFVTLDHPTYNGTISLQAKPFPCNSDRLDCSWIDAPDLGRMLASYRFKHFIVGEGNKVLLVEADVIEMSEKGFSLLLPEVCHEIGSRRVTRHLCKGIGAVLSQNGAESHGSLRNFNSISLGLELPRVSSPAFHWIDGESPVHLCLTDGERTIFSGQCAIMRQSWHAVTETVVVKPLHHQIHRFKPKVHRSVRQKLVPSPHAEFVHPLIQKAISLTIIDVSASGFSVEEDEANSVLLPGMILPKVEIRFADRFTIGCMAQVVYRKTVEGDNRRQVKCGLAVLDMQLADHIRLAGLLNQAADGNSYLCTPVDMGALWRFFFESGFISPQKYASFQENKEEIKRTFERLYSQQSGIALHFTYQDRGRILGHMAMIRTYDRSWLIHHHAADKTESVKAGLVVLNQISRYVNDVHHLSSAHLDYVFCYYRPDNRFPNRVFGEFARRLNEPKGCSLDTFAYFHHRAPPHEEGSLPQPWELEEASPFELQELKDFYGYHSGGLLLEAFSLGADGQGLAREYGELGFKKESSWFSLKKEGKLQAILLANVTDAGLNMSNLTNCVTVMVFDAALPQEMLRAALCLLSTRYEGGHMPVLLHPVSYAERAAFNPEKHYTLWVLNLQYLDHYFDFCNDIFRHIPKAESSLDGQ